MCSHDEDKNLGYEVTYKPLLYNFWILTPEYGAIQLS